MDAKRQQKKENEIPKRKQKMTVSFDFPQRPKKAINKVNKALDGLSPNSKCEAITKVCEQSLSPASKKAVTTM